MSPDDSTASLFLVLQAGARPCGTLATVKQVRRCGLTLCLCTVTIINIGSVESQLSMFTCVLY